MVEVGDGTGILFTLEDGKGVGVEVVAKADKLQEPTNTEDNTKPTATLR